MITLLHDGHCSYPSPTPPFIGNYEESHISLLIALKLRIEFNNLCKVHAIDLIGHDSSNSLLNVARAKFIDVHVDDFPMHARIDCYNLLP